jgi:hypothetical protein
MKKISCVFILLVGQKLCAQFGITAPGGSANQYNNGAVGIGVSTPLQYKLEVNGSIGATGNVSITSTNNNNTYPLSIVQNSSQFEGVLFTGNSLGRTSYELRSGSTPTYSRFKTFVDGRTYIGQFSSPAYDGTSSMLTIGQTNSSYKALSIMNNTNATATDMLSIYGNGNLVSSGSIDINSLNNNSNNPLKITQNGSQMEGILFNGNSLGRTAYEVRAGSSPSYSRFKTFVDGHTYIGQFTSPVYDGAAPMLVVGQSNPNAKAISVKSSLDPTAPDAFAVFGNGNASIGGTHLIYNSDHGVIDWGNGTQGDLHFRKLSTQGNIGGYTELVTFMQNGSVGVGTTGPIAKLEVRETSADAEMLVSSYNGSVNRAAKMWVGNNQLSYGFGIDNNNIGHIWLDRTSPIPIISFQGYGSPATVQAWIGAQKPVSVHSDFKFAVAGKLLAKSIYVNADPLLWPDYVFAENYKLMPLEELEAFYKANKHLPEVPTAKDVKTEGDNLLITDMAILKKVEELTLYIVELKKEINELKAKK